MIETSPTPCLLVNWDEPDSLRKEHDASDQENLPQPPEHKKTAPWDESGQRDGGKNYRRESHWSRLCARLCCVLNAGKIIGLFFWLVIVKIRVVLNLHLVGRHRGWTAMWLDDLGLPQSWSTIPSPCPYGTFRIHQPRKVLKWFWPFLKLATNFTRIELLEAGLEGGAWTWWWVEEEHRQADQSLILVLLFERPLLQVRVVLLLERPLLRMRVVLLYDHPLLMSTSEEDSCEKNRRPVFPSQEEEGEERQLLLPLFLLVCTSHSS